MSKIGFIQDKSEVLATGSTLTIVQLVAGTNHPISILGWGVGFNSVAAADEPILCRLRIQTSAGTSGTGTIEQQDRQHNATFDTSALIDFTAEPTDGGDLVDVWPTKMVHPSSGYELWYPEGKEPTIATAERVGLQVISGVLATSLDEVSGFIFFEE